MWVWASVHKSSSSLLISTHCLSSVYQFYKSSVLGLNWTRILRHWFFFIIGTVRRRRWWWWVNHSSVKCSCLSWALHRSLSYMTLEYVMTWRSSVIFFSPPPFFFKVTGLQLAQEVQSPISPFIHLTAVTITALTNSRCSSLTMTQTPRKVFCVQQTLKCQKYPCYSFYQPSPSDHQDLSFRCCPFFPFFTFPGYFRLTVRNYRQIEKWQF